MKHKGGTSAPPERPPQGQKVCKLDEILPKVYYTLLGRSTGGKTASKDSLRDASVAQPSVAPPWRSLARESRRQMDDILSKADRARYANIKCPAGA